VQFYPVERTVPEDILDDDSIERVRNAGTLRMAWTRAGSAGPLESRWIRVDSVLAVV